MSFTKARISMIAFSVLFLPAAVIISSCAFFLREKPNVIILVMDTVTVEHVSAYGFEEADTTPNIKEFANHATKYLRAYSTSSWTLPAHGSLFTGLYPSTSGIHFDEDGDTRAGPPRNYAFNRVPDAAELLTETLRDNGYTTAGFASNSCLQIANGFTQGFETYLERWDIKGSDHKYPPADTVNREVLTWLEDSPDRPFFLFVNYLDAHSPRLSHPELEFPDNPHYMSLYWQGIRWVDIAIGEVLDKLKEAGEYDNSMIFILSDHGNHFGEKGYISHSNSLYEQLVHVPMLVKMPHQKQPRVEDKLVSWIDIYPTITNELGIAPPTVLEGQHLNDPRRSVFFELTREHDNRGRHTGEYHYLRGVILDNMKLIEAEDRIEVYNLEGDPQENNNLYESASTISENLKAELKKYEVAGPIFEKASVKKQMDKRTEKSLRALGYLD